MVEQIKCLLVLVLQRRPSGFLNNRLHGFGLHSEPVPHTGEQNLELLLRGTLGAMGLNDRLVTHRTYVIPYLLDVLNPDADLDQIVEGYSDARPHDCVSTTHLAPLNLLSAIIWSRC